jgi:hypothetical protein
MPESFSAFACWLLSLSTRPLLVSAAGNTQPSDGLTCSSNRISSSARTRAVIEMLRFAYLFFPNGLWM